MVVAVVGGDGDVAVENANIVHEAIVVVEVEDKR